MFDPTSNHSPVIARLRGHSRKNAVVGRGVLGGGVAVVVAPVPIRRVVLQKRRDQVVVRPPGQVVVLGAEQDQQIVQGRIRHFAVGLGPEPEGLFHGRFRFGLQAAREVRALRVEQVEDPDVVGQGEVGPGGFLGFLRRERRNLLVFARCRAT